MVLKDAIKEILVNYRLLWLHAEKNLLSSVWVHQLQHLNVLKMRQLEGAVIHLFLWAQETPNDISAEHRQAAQIAVNGP